MWRAGIELSELEIESLGEHRRDTRTLLLHAHVLGPGIRLERVGHHAVDAGEALYEL